MPKNTKEYDNIINLVHYVSKTHPRMSLEARSAQFASFAALTGYDEVINETARLTNERIEINEEIKNILDKKIYLIKKQLHTRPKVTITYFIPDLKKEGGKYTTVTGNIIKIDNYIQKIILEKNIQVQISEIIDITSDIFKE